MPGLEDFSRIVSGIYAGALKPGAWIAALDDIRQTLGAEASGLLAADDSGRSVKCASLPDTAREAYSAHYRFIDYVLEDVERGPVGLVRAGVDLVGINPNSEFNIDWMRPHHVDDGLFVRLTAEHHPLCFIVAAQKLSAPFATAARVEFVQALLPHLQQALRTQESVAALGDARDDVATVLEATSRGVLVARRDGHVVRLNSAAQAVLDHGDGLRTRRGRIEATCRGANVTLQRCIHAAAVSGDRGYRSGNSLTCARPSGKYPYVLHVLPLHPGRSSGPALIAIVDPEVQPRVPKTLLRKAFGLTNAESEVALRVLRGQGLAPISEELSLSLPTVRTHLQHVFDKTDTHRQAELVRLLFALVP